MMFTIDAQDESITDVVPRLSKRPQVLEVGYDNYGGDLGDDLNHIDLKVTNWGIKSFSYRLPPVDPLSWDFDEFIDKTKWLAEDLSRLKELTLQFLPPTPTELFIFKDFVKIFSAVHAHDNVTLNFRGIKTLSYINCGWEKLGQRNAPAKIAKDFEKSLQKEFPNVTVNFCEDDRLEGERVISLITSAALKKLCAPKVKN